jgi:hypothetical protein
MLVQVAGRRWTVEEAFQTGKGLTGLDQHQVRRWTSWHRWTVMAMLAHAFLTVVASTERIPESCSTNPLTAMTQPIAVSGHALNSHPTPSYPTPRPPSVQSASSFCPNRTIT